MTLRLQRRDKAHSFSFSFSFLIRWPDARLVWIVVPIAIDLLYDRFYLAVNRIIFCIKILFETAAKKECNGLVHSCIHATAVFFDDVVTVVTGFPVDQFHQHLALVY